MVSKDWAKWKGSGQASGTGKEWGGGHREGGPQEEWREARGWGVRRARDSARRWEDGTLAIVLGRVLGSGHLEKLGLTSQQRV